MRSYAALKSHKGSSGRGMGVPGVTSGLHRRTAGSNPQDASMGTCGCGATQVVTVSLAGRTLTSWPDLAFQMNMAPPSDPEHTNSL